ncbi:type II secretion system protein [Hydrogenovibrio halophilus]|uniref:type II secretion system protein n=1 Tax=Hydrogenovibrio halophilus TaxID=373391 RepID=UPI00035C47C9|nr:type II secretion system protein [Hydrogenovibrio halophilus]
MKPFTYAPRTHRQNGFTLVEIAIVLAILGFLTAGILGGLGAFRDSADFKQDERQLKDIKEALLSFVAVNGYLPCPDTDGDGRENRDGDNSCTSSSDELPFADLGTHSKNPWGHSYQYVVNSEAISLLTHPESASYFNNETGAPHFEITTEPTASESGDGNYLIKDAGDKYLMGHKNSSGDWEGTAPLIVLSMGSNHINADDAGDCSVFDGDEKANCEALFAGGSDPFIRGQQSRQDNDFFDDALIWLTALEIKRFTPGVLPDGSSGGGGGGGGGGGYPLSSLPDEEFEVEDARYVEEYVNQSNKIKGNEVVDIGELDLEGNSPLNLEGGENTVRINEMGNSGPGNSGKYTPIKINSNDNKLELSSDLKADLEVSGNKNLIRIEGSVDSPITLSGSDNEIYVGESVDYSIVSSGLNNEVYLESETLADMNGSISSSVRVYEKDGDDWNCVQNCDD